MEPEPPTKQMQSLLSSSCPINYGKEKMERRSRECWACGVHGVNKVRVISNGDNAISFLERKGLINFDTFSWRSNSVALCPTCHRRFNDPTDPHFAFWPEDLDFFIRFELRDRARRRRLPPPSPQPQIEESKRRVPTANQYKVHMQRKRAIEVEREGWGTYYWVHLVNRGAPGVFKESPIKEWRGAPFAAIKRTIRIIGCPRSAKIPNDVLEKLQILRDLYYGEEDMEAQMEVEKKYGLDPFAEPDDDIDNLDESGNDEGDSSDDEEDNWTPPKKRRKKTPLKRWTEISSEVSFDYTSWNWKKYGPESLSENNRL